MRARKSPGPEAIRVPKRRAELLHTFLHHELQAAELMCWAILAFPETPEAFRLGLLGVARDEIRAAAASITERYAWGRYSDRFMACPRNLEEDLLLPLEQDLAVVNATRGVHDAIPIEELLTGQALIGLDLPFNLAVIQLGIDFCRGHFCPISPTQLRQFLL